VTSVKRKGPKRLIADVDPDFHDRLKLACALTGQSIREFCVSRLEPKINKVLKQNGVLKFKPSTTGKALK
tara:strand:- start:1170 stop:1379 length:210 start_codon:yes stop_codon:yes gene_type:complete